MGDEEGQELLVAECRASSLMPLNHTAVLNPGTPGLRHGERAWASAPEDVQQASWRWPFH